MDNYRGFEEDASAAAPEEEPSIERPPEIGVDERRMHVRAYNYWVSLLAGRAYPAIQDVDPHTIEDFGPHSVLLDFSGDAGGSRDRLPRPARCAPNAGWTPTIRRISEVPSRSLLSRLTDHYLQIIANRAPIGFEAEFVSQRGHNTLYRGILMPLSSDGEAIDFIYGVINWKEMADADTAVGARQPGRGAVAARAAAGRVRRRRPGLGGRPQCRFRRAASAVPEAPIDDGTLSLWPEAPGLADRLSAARFCAEEAAGADQRSRHALYRALGHA